MSYETVAASATSHCPLQDAAGTSDIVDNNRANGTWIGASRSVTTGPTSWLPSAITFSSNRVETGWLPSSSFNRSVSLTSWIRPTSVASTANFQSTRFGNGGFIFRIHSGPLLRAYFGTGSTLPSLDASHTPVVNTWIHVAVTAGYTGDVKFYVNGVQSGSTQSMPTGALDYNPADTVGYCIGAQGDGGAPWIGQLADVLFFENQVLSETEINYLYNGPSASIAKISYFYNRLRQR